MPIFLTIWAVIFIIGVIQFIREPCRDVSDFIIFIIVFGILSGLVCGLLGILLFGGLTHIGLECEDYRLELTDQYTIYSVVDSENGNTQYGVRRGYNDNDEYVYRVMYHNENLLTYDTKDFEADHCHITIIPEDQEPYIQFYDLYHPNDVIAALCGNWTTHYYIYLPESAITQTLEIDFY